MGQDKALLAIDGIPLLTRVCGVAKQCADPVLVVTPWAERYRAIVEGVVWVNELQQGTELNGSLIGFIRGLEKTQTDWVLLLACDLPHLRAEVLQEWQALLPDAGAAALPKNPGGWWEPLCGFYRRESLESLQQYVADGGRSFQGWLSHQSVYELPVGETQMLLNCNTPDDLLA
jgi:molybdenum cofactor guanylyltransferase